MGSHLRFRLQDLYHALAWHALPYHYESSVPSRATTQRYGPGHLSRGHSAGARSRRGGSGPRWHHWRPAPARPPRTWPDGEGGGHRQRHDPGRPDQVARPGRSSPRPGLGQSPITEVAVLLASETVTNAVLHSNSRRPDGTVDVTAHGYRRRGADRGDRRGSELNTPVVKADGCITGGHGLFLVQSLADQWGYLRDESGPRCGSGSCAAGGAPRSSKTSPTDREVLVRRARRRPGPCGQGHRSRWRARRGGAFAEILICGEPRAGTPAGRPERFSRAASRGARGAREAELLA